MFINIENIEKFQKKLINMDRLKIDLGLNQLISVEQSINN
jgi:hypothetical protein